VLQACGQPIAVETAAPQLIDILQELDFVRYRFPTSGVGAIANCSWFFSSSRHRLTRAVANGDEYPQPRLWSETPVALDRRPPMMGDRMNQAINPNSTTQGEAPAELESRDDQTQLAQLFPQSLLRLTTTSTEIQINLATAGLQEHSDCNLLPTRPQYFGDPIP
jgi:hypothetical protein